MVYKASRTECLKLIMMVQSKIKDGDIYSENS